MMLRQIPPRRKRAHRILGEKPVTNAATVAVCDREASVHEVLHMADQALVDRRGAVAEPAPVACARRRLLSTRLESER